MGWEWREHNRAKVLAHLQQGDYEAIVTSKEGALDALAYLAAELGVLDAVSLLEVEREREGIPDELLFRGACLLPFIEAAGLSAASESLFADAAILLQIGYTALQVQNGFNKRRGAKRESKETGSLPCHPDVLRNELLRVKPESMAAFRQECIKRLHKKGLIKGKVYAVDGSGIGSRWRLVGLYNVCKGRKLWLTWRLLSGNDSEKGKEGTVLFEMIDEIRQIVGEDAIEWVLMDALYADGPLLAGLKYQRGIDALVRLPEDRVMYADLWFLLQYEPERWQEHLDVRYVSGRKQLRQVRVGAVPELQRWDSFVEAAAVHGESNPVLWGCGVASVDQSNPGDKEEWALISTRPFNTGWQGYTFWRQRWSIENNGFRELKEGWLLEKAPWSYTHEALVLARVTFTLIAANVAEIAKTTQGRQLTGQGIRRLRRQLNREVGSAPVIVFAAGAYGIFNIEEVMTALGKPPMHSLRPNVRTATSRGRP
jgi:hypothetical protein